MKALRKIIALLLAVLMMLTAVACKTPTPDGPSESTPNVSSPNESSSDDPGSSVTPESSTYNVIFALASIPPVLAALEAIENGYPTYAIIERGKTYSGIEELENFVNVGFDPANNLSTGFTSTEFNSMVAKVKELAEANGEAYFNFYVQDGTALVGAAIAANAGLGADRFHVYMCEDGTGAYNALYTKYLKDKNVSADSDEVYDNYVAKLAEAKAEYEAIMAKTDNAIGDAALKYNIGKAYALAGLDNFTYYIQDESLIVDLLENTGDVKTKLLTSFGVEGYNADVEFELNLKYGKISDAVSRLTEEQRTDYLTLMYGQYYADTYAALTRTERADEDAPSKKLVFIGARHSGYPKLASSLSYGIGGLAADATVPTSYAELDDKYKNELLFATEGDYQLFLDELAKEENYTAEISDEVKNKVAVACFNYYIDYIFTLKLTYAVYGEDYDLIMKGHPREVIGSWEEWGSRYKVTYTADGAEANYVYDKLYDNVLLSFHANDSTGKYIGMVPYGTAAENLAYLGADIAIAGLPSSTYNGYDTDVDVVFILAETNEDIVGTGVDTAASQVKERYLAGNLKYTDKDGETHTTVFYNIGNVYKTLSEVFAEKGNEALAAAYSASFEAWLDSVYPDAVDLDGQGFAVVEGKEE